MKSAARRLELSAMICSALLLLVASAPSTAADTPGSIVDRLDQAVQETLAPLVGALDSSGAETVELELRDRTKNRRLRIEYSNPWQIISPGLFDFLEDDADNRVYLVDVLEKTASAYMRALGEVAWELGQSGTTSAMERLATLDPGKMGDGVIFVVSLPGIYDLQMHFRGILEYDRRGDETGLVAAWVHQPDPKLEPLACRLVVPIARFEAQVHRQGRSYGRAPVLVPSRSVLQIWDGESWIPAPAEWRGGVEQARVDNRRASHNR